MAPLLQFKAGRAARRGETNWVDPSPGRGLVYLQEEDGLLHFYYKDLEHDSTDDLIIFPGDATFAKASERVYVLKFSSSSHRHFFWAQDVDASKDAEHARKVNELIGATGMEDEEMEVEQDSSAAPVAAPAPVASSAPQTATASSAPATGDSALGSEAQMAQLRNLIAGLSGKGGSAGYDSLPEYLLTDVLPSSILTPLLTPSLTTSLTPFLPSEIPSTTESLRTAVESPEFRRSVASLDRALRTGALGPLVAGLGLEARSAEGVAAFLEGIQKQADEENAKKGEQRDMQTD